MIEASSISFTYAPGLPWVLRDISFILPPGGSLALLGPNGAGKTTLLDIILGWSIPASGSIRIRGSRPHELSRREAGLVMSLAAQSEHITFSFTVLEYVLFGRAPHLSVLSAPSAEDREIAHRALREVKLSHLAHRQVTTLSGGETQLVKLARSIAQDTPLLLLDEPTSDLDPGNTSRVVELLMKRHRQGTTLVFTTHDPMVASEAADHVALLSGGKLLKFGYTDEVLTESLLGELYGTPMRVMSHGNQRIIYRDH